MQRNIKSEKDWQSNILVKFDYIKVCSIFGNVMHNLVHCYNLLRVDVARHPSDRSLYAG